MKLGKLLIPSILAMMAVAACGPDSPSEPSVQDSIGDSESTSVESLDVYHWSDAERAYMELNFMDVLPEFKLPEDAEVEMLEESPNGPDYLFQAEFYVDFTEAPDETFDDVEAKLTEKYGEPEDYDEDQVMLWYYEVLEDSGIYEQIVYSYNHAEAYIDVLFYAETMKGMMKWTEHFFAAYETSGTYDLSEKAPDFPLVTGEHNCYALMASEPMPYYALLIEGCTPADAVNFENAATEAGFAIHSWIGGAGTPNTSWYTCQGNDLGFVLVDETASEGCILLHLESGFSMYQGQPSDYYYTDSEGLNWPAEALAEFYDSYFEITTTIPAWKVDDNNVIVNAADMMAYGYGYVITYQPYENGAAASYAAILEDAGWDGGYDADDDSYVYTNDDGAGVYFYEYNGSFTLQFLPASALLPVEEFPTDDVEAYFASYGITTSIVPWKVDDNNVIAQAGYNSSYDDYFIAYEVYEEGAAASYAALLEDAGWVGEYDEYDDSYTYTNADGAGVYFYEYQGAFCLDFNPAVRFLGYDSFPSSDIANYLATYGITDVEVPAYKVDENNTLNSAEDWGAWGFILMYNTYEEDADDQYAAILEQAGWTGAWDVDDESYTYTKDGVEVYFYIYNGAFTISIYVA